MSTHSKQMHHIRMSLLTSCIIVCARSRVHSQDTAVEAAAFNSKDPGERPEEEGAGCGFRGPAAAPPSEGPSTAVGSQSKWGVARISSPLEPSVLCPRICGPSPKRAVQQNKNRGWFTIAA